MKTCLIDQPAGLGDILLCQKIAHKYANQDYDVLWPVIEEYEYLPESIYTHDRIKFISKKEPLPPNIDQTIPLSTASRYYENCNDPYMTLAAKFMICGTVHTDWADYFQIKRNKERENVIFHDVLNLKEGEEYIFVNRNFASPPHSEKAHLPHFIDKKVVEMEFLGWDRIFDWLKVLERASEIHTVQTSLQILMEKLELSGKMIKIYPRTGYHRGFSYAKPFYVRHEYEYVE